MKKTIIATLAALSLTASAMTVAAVSNDETAYLFGAQEAVEMQVISSDEMAMTEGQLFGVSFEFLGTYLDKAAIIIKPIFASAKIELSAAFQAIKAAASVAIASQISGALGKL